MRRRTFTVQDLAAWLGAALAALMIVSLIAFYPARPQKTVSVEKTTNGTAGELSR
jgi:hypothetical protein